MKARELGSQVVVGLSLLCALTMTSIVAWHEFGGGKKVEEPGGTLQSRAVAEWDELLRRGYRLGNVSAPIVLVEFADFECPYCRTFAMTDLPTLMAKYPDKIQVVYRHFPLPYHRFARPSAVAAECAGRQGKFPEMYAQLYQQQDSLGLLPYDTLAARSGVSDLQAFALCQRDPNVAEVVEDDFELGRRIDVSSTPTIAVNGVVFSRPPTSTELSQVVESLLEQ